MRAVLIVSDRYTVPLPKASPSASASQPLTRTLRSNTRGPPHDQDKYFKYTFQIPSGLRGLRRWGLGRRLYRGLKARERGWVLGSQPLPTSNGVWGNLMRISRKIWHLVTANDWYWLTDRFDSIVLSTNMDTTNSVCPNFNDCPKIFKSPIWWGADAADVYLRSL